VAKVLLGLSIAFASVVLCLTAYELVFKIKTATFRTFQPVPVDDYTIRETCTDLKVHFLGMTGFSISQDSQVVRDELCGANTFHVLKPNMLTRWGCQRTDRVLKCTQPLGKFIKDAGEAAEKRARR
jgi:hypothetical protein